MKPFFHIQAKSSLRYSLEVVDHCERTNQTAKISFYWCYTQNLSLYRTLKTSYHFPFIEQVCASCIAQSHKIHIKYIKVKLAWQNFEKFIGFLKLFSYCISNWNYSTINAFPFYIKHQGNKLSRKHLENQMFCKPTGTSLDLSNVFFNVSCVFIGRK